MASRSVSMLRACSCGRIPHTIVWDRRPSSGDVGKTQGKDGAAEPAKEPATNPGEEKK
jgi:hypothetical protein